MDLELKNIIEGYRKLKTKDKKVIWLADRRMRQCLSCKLFTDNQTCNSKLSGPHIKTGNITTGCGCFMPAKTKLLKAKCPLGKW